MGGLRNEVQLVHGVVWTTHDHANWRMLEEGKCRAPAPRCYSIMYRAAHLTTCPSLSQLFSGQLLSSAYQPIDLQQDAKMLLVDARTSRFTSDLRCKKDPESTLADA